MALSAKSEWSKENNQHNFVELLAFYRHQLLPVNPSSIAAVKDAATYDTSKVATKPPTKYYCHLHGSNNTHNGAECKKMGSPNFTMKGKTVTQAMIDNRVPGKVVDGVAGKK